MIRKKKLKNYIGKSLLHLTISQEKIGQPWKISIILII